MPRDDEIVSDDRQRSTRGRSHDPIGKELPTARQYSAQGRAADYRPVEKGIFSLVLAEDRVRPVGVLRSHRLESTQRGKRKIDDKNLLSFISRGWNASMALR